MRVNSVLIHEHDSSVTRHLKRIKISERTHFDTSKMLIIIGSIIAIVIVSIIRKVKLFSCNSLGSY